MDEQPKTTEAHDSRERGLWQKNWPVLFWMPKYCRPVYAYWQMGGGIDEWEYSDAP